jgi:hypothetical protein
VVGRAPPLASHLRVRQSGGCPSHRAAGCRNVTALCFLVSRRVLALHASSNVVSIQRWGRVPADGNIGNSIRRSERSYDADSVASPWALRTGEGPSGLEPESPVCPVRRVSVGHGGACFDRSRRPEAARDVWWLPKRGEGRSRPEPIPQA